MFPLALFVLAARGPPVPIYRCFTNETAGLNHAWLRCDANDLTRYKTSEAMFQEKFTYEYNERYLDMKSLYETDPAYERTDDYLRPWFGLYMRPYYEHYFNTFPPHLVSRLQEAFQFVPGKTLQLEADVMTRGISPYHNQRLGSTFAFIVRGPWYNTKKAAIITGFGLGVRRLYQPSGPDDISRPTAFSFLMDEGIDSANYVLPGPCPLFPECTQCGDCQHDVNASTYTEGLRLAPKTLEALWLHVTVTVTCGAVDPFVVTTTITATADPTQAVEPTIINATFTHVLDFARQLPSLGADLNMIGLLGQQTSARVENLVLSVSPNTVPIPATAAPTTEPSATPSAAPTTEPSATPSVEPTIAPSVEPSAAPSVNPPTAAPTAATPAPTVQAIPAPQRSASNQYAGAVTALGASLAFVVVSVVCAVVYVRRRGRRRFNPGTPPAETRRIEVTSTNEYSMPNIRPEPVYDTATTAVRARHRRSREPSVSRSKYGQTTLTTDDDSDVSMDETLPSVTRNVPAAIYMHPTDALV